MPPTDNTFSPEHALRQRAEEAAREVAIDASDDAEDLSPSAMRRVIHELRRTQAALDTAQARYFDFYDLAPVGYLAVSAQGLILHANLTTATLLGVARSALPHQAISRFIDRSDQDTFFLLCQKLAEINSALSCELQMVTHDGRRFSARLDAISARGEDGAPLLRLVLIDITASKEAMAQRLAMDQDILNAINAEQEQQRVLHEAAQREALVREVHHRIKNKLQGIGGLLQQFGSQKPEIAEQMQLVTGHLNGISIIHGLQGSQDDARVRLCELTREIAQANSALWQTDIAIDIPAPSIFYIVAEKEAVSLALVLNELMVNAIKHGGRAHGHVRVTLQQGPNAEGVELSIFNAGYLRNNQDRPTRRHHGLQLVESLRPREGLKISLTQHGDQVHTLLQVTAPVLTLEMPPIP